METRKIQRVLLRGADKVHRVGELASRSGALPAPARRRRKDDGIAKGDCEAAVGEEAWRRDVAMADREHASDGVGVLARRVERVVFVCSDGPGRARAGLLLFARDASRGVLIVLLRLSPHGTELGQEVHRDRRRRRSRVPVGDQRGRRGGAPRRTARGAHMVGTRRGVGQRPLPARAGLHRKRGARCVVRGKYMDGWYIACVST